METVFKYALPVDDLVTVEMPKGAELLRVDVQATRLCLWARVDSALPLVHRRIRIAGTGHPLTEEGYVYISTFYLDGGALVFHAFDAGEATT